MNLAILIGVSEYKTLSKLPGCKNDVKSISELIYKTEKFEKILEISEKTDSTSVKNQLIDFINISKDEEVDEVIFYFTGHGSYVEDEFYYILSDFDSSRKTQTSLQNSELDSLLKTLNPKLVVKFVDACQSGFSYIKDVDSIDNYIKSTKGNFKNCYFLFSSLSMQSSYQNQDFSFFTLSILNAVKNHSDEKVRYKNIIDYVSDEFYKNSIQTPFFVTQANFTEIFCTKNKILDNFLNSIPNTFENSKEIIEEVSSEIKSIEQLVILDSQKNLSNDKVNEFFKNIKETIENFEINQEYKNLYDFVISFPTHNNSPKSLASIGDYLSKNKGYFAEASYEDVEYESIETPKRSVSILSSFNNQPFTVTKTRKEISGYYLTTKYPFEQIKIDIKSKYPNLNSFNCSIFFISNDRKIRFYWFLTSYIKKSWSEQDLDTRFNWNIFEYEFVELEIIDQNLKKINAEINKLLDNHIQKILDKK